MDGEQAVFQAALEAHKRGDFAEAERYYRKVSHKTNALHNLGSLFNTLGRLDEAEAAFRLVLEHFPDRATSRFALGLTLLERGRYAEGWALCEARRQIQEVGLIPPRTSAPEWMGEPLRGRKLVVCPEQGLGDQIMFGRYLGLIREMGADVTVATYPPLRRLFEAAGYETAPYLRSDPTIPDCDAWVFFCSLPLRAGIAEIPPAEYLPQPPPRVREGRGVVPTGASHHRNDKNRSLPLDAAERLLRSGMDLRPEATGAQDMWATAEIISGLEEIVTVDTAVAHLAGSLGWPVKVLLPSIGTDWRWGRTGDVSPWYSSARLMRQTRPGEWSALLDAIDGGR